MNLETRPGRRLLPTLASIAAAVLGVVAGAGGVALIIALASSEQPRNQRATAAVLTLAGIVNLVASRGIYHERERPILLSGIVTLGLLGYSALAIHDFGEFFWLHAAFLGLLAMGEHRRLTGGLTAA